MANEHHATVEIVDGVRQRVNGLDIQVIGGLVQEQHVRVLPRQPGKTHSTLLTVWQVLDRTYLEDSHEVSAIQINTPLMSELSSILPAVSQSDHNDRWSSASPPSLWFRGNISSCTPEETSPAPVALSDAGDIYRSWRVNVCGSSRRWAGATIGEKPLKPLLTGLLCDHLATHLSHQQLQQRGLACSIRSHQSHSRI